MAPFRVHTYHINVDNGDCAIHLLVDDAAAIPDVLRAVLIDGGDPGNASLTEIRRVIAHIENNIRYTLSPMNNFRNNQLSFDSIVITHWDEDHWGGVRDLIYEDYTAAMAGNLAMTTLMQNSQLAWTADQALHPTKPFDNYSAAELRQIDQIQQLPPYCTYQCRYMKYAGNPTLNFQVERTFAQWLPLTTLYVPYQHVTTEARPPRVARHYGSGIGPSEVNKGRRITLRCNNDQTYDFNAPNNYNPALAPPPVPNTLDVLVRFEYTRVWDMHRQAFKDITIARVCKLVAHYQAYLGVELLTNTPLPGASAAVTDPSTLLQLHGILAGAGPRIFIVAGCQQLIGPQVNRAPRATAVPPNILSRFAKRGPLVRIVDNSVPPPPTLQANRNSSSVKKNSASICCLMLSTTPTGGFKVRHYFAGDALWDMEAAIAEWLRPTAFLPAPPPLNAPFMKLSHHGDYKATPIVLLEALEPRHIIASSGRNKPTTGHPRWEILFYLYAMTRRSLHNSWPAISPTYAVPPLLPTNYPHYFTHQTSWIVNNFSKVNAGALANPTRVEVVYVANLINCLDAGGIDPTSTQHLWKEWSRWRAGAGAAVTAVQMTTQIIHMLAAAWDDISTINPPIVRPPAAVLPRSIRAFLLIIGEDDDDMQVLSYTNLNPWRPVPRSPYDPNIPPAPPPGPPPPPPPPPPGPATGPPVLDPSVPRASVDEAQAFIARSRARRRADAASMGPSANDYPHAYNGPRAGAGAGGGGAVMSDDDDDDSSTRMTDVPVSDANGSSSSSLTSRFVVPVRNKVARAGTATTQAKTSRSEMDEKMDTVAVDESEADEEAGDLPPLTTPFSRSEAPDGEPADGEDFDAAEDVNDLKSAGEEIHAISHATSNGSVRRTISHSLGSANDPKSNESLTSTHVGSQSNPFLVHGMPIRDIVPAVTGSSQSLSVAAPSTSFVVYCRAFGPLTPPVVDTEGILSADTVNDGLNDFISALHNGYVILDDKLTPTAAAMPVAKNDEWMQRVAAITGSTSLSFKGTSTAGNVTITDITAAFSAFGGLSFSLSKTISTFPGVTSHGFLPKYNMMILGLETTTTSRQITVAGIFSLFDLPSGPGIFALDAEAGPTLDTSSGSQSGLYFLPDTSYTTWLRLSFNLDTKKIQSFLNFLGGDGTPQISNAKIVGRKKIKCSRNGLSLLAQTDSQIVIQADIDLTSKVSPFTVYLILGSDTTELKIRFGKEQHFEDMIDWLCLLFNKHGDGQSTVVKDQVHPSNSLPDGALGSDQISLKVQEISVTLKNPSPGPGQTFKFQSVSIILELDVYKACFFVTVSMPNISLVAELWELLPPNAATKMLPYIDDYSYYTPLSPSVTGTLDLADLFPGGKSMPAGIPSIVTEARLEVYTFDDDKRFNFTGAIVCQEPGEQSVPVVRMSDLRLSASYETTNKEWKVELLTRIILYPRDWSKDNPGCAKLDISVAYDNGAWTFNAAAYELRFAALFALFDPGASHSVMNLLEKFWIPTLQVQYQYTKGQASHLSITGTLMMGPMELDLDYEHDGTKWTLKAHLGMAGAKAHLLTELLAGLDQSVADDLAGVPFINKINIPGTTPPSSGFSNAPVQMLVHQEPLGGTVMWLRLEIDTPAGNISLLYVQYQSPPPEGSKDLPSVKRLLRIKLDKLPSLPKIPVVGSLPQPLDSIDYIWVQKNPKAEAGKPQGFQRSDLDEINAQLEGDEIPFRDPAAATSAAGADQKPAPAAKDKTAKATDYLLLAGHHFIIVTDGQVVLDHIFGASPQIEAQKKILSTASVKPALGGGRIKLGQGIATNDSILQKDSGPTTGSTKKSFGALTIQNLGLQTKDGYLYLLVDATIALGPIQLTLIGFGVGLPLSDLSLNTLKHIHIEDFKVILSGMSVYFNAPPVTVAGVFIDGSTPGVEFYEGGIALSILPYTLLAVGAYRHQLLPAEEFKSVFIFARLDGPLFTLEFAEISGVEAGFGYNYDIRLPHAADITSFPLVQGVQVAQPITATTAGSTPVPSPASPNNPLALLQQFNTWVTPRNTFNWLALGFKVDAFRVLTVDAAAIVAFGPSSLKIAIVGMASASMPPNVPNPRESILYVELGISVVLDPFGGSLWAEAQLTPNSFILHPDCHLTGGFALCYWFKGSPYEGDWVFSVGGFHPAFNPPAYYPKPPRVAISWNLSDVLSVRGEAFFAVTPKACMAGGTLVARFSCGPIYANFTCWAMFLVIYKPFFFIGDIGIRMEIGYHCDLGLLSFDIHVDFGGDLHLSGPPFGGYIDVDISVCSFRVYFGDQSGGSEPLSWEEFEALVLAPGPANANPPANDPKSDPKADPNMVVVALVTGSADEKTSTPSGGHDEHWFVRAGTFSFRVESKFAMDSMEYSMKYGDEVNTLAAPLTPPVPPIAKIFARGMHTSVTTSVLRVTVQRVADKNVQTTKIDPDKPFNVVPIIRQAPLALWGEYTWVEDPLNPNANVGNLLDGTNVPTAPHLMGFMFHTPDPTLPPSNQQLPDFNAVDAMKEAVLDIAPTLPSTPAPQPLFNPAPMTASREDENRRVQNWTTAQAAWNATDMDAATLFVQTWTDTFAWADKSKQVAPIARSKDSPDTVPVQFPAPSFTPLQAKRPQHLVDALNVFYLGAPCLSSLPPIPTVVPSPVLAPPAPAPAPAPAPRPTPA